MPSKEDKLFYASKVSVSDCLGSVLSGLIRLKVSERAPVILTVVNQRLGLVYRNCYTDQLFTSPVARADAVSHKEYTNACTC